ncbi:hypothetical protein ACQPVP_05305 [Clostridium nigeriense]
MNLNTVLFKIYGVIMLEVEFVIVVMVFISVEFIFKKAFYKKIDTQF